MEGDVAALTTLAADPLESDAFRLEAARGLQATAVGCPEARDDVLRGLLHVAAMAKGALRREAVSLFLGTLKASGQSAGTASRLARQLCAVQMLPADLLAALLERESFWHRLFAGRSSRGAAAGT
jgi:hypothetical protein